MPKNRATRPPPVQTRAPPGAGSSSMDLDEPVDLRVEPLPSAPSRPSASSPDGEEPDMEKAKYHLAKMIALRGYDPSIIDDDCFKSFVESLNPKFRLPSRDNIEAVCKTIFETEMSHSLEIMEDYANRINLAMGKAKVFESEVIYMAFHFTDDEWNLHQVIQKVVIINPISFEAHVNIALSMISRTAESEYNISGATVFTVAWGITDDLSKLKDFLNDDSNLLPHDDALKRKVLCTTFMDYILHSIAEHLYLNIDAEFNRYIFKSVLANTSTDQQVELLSLHDLDLWTYKEAWYLWYCLLTVELEERGTGLEFSKLLCKIFGEIYRAIRKMSTSSGPTANLCLLELFHVRTFLKSEIALASGGGHTKLYEVAFGFVDDKDIVTVLTELTEILDKAIQESYLVWSIPLVLDPRYKLGFVTTIFTEAFGQVIADHYISELSTYIKMRYSEYVINEAFEHEWERQEAQEELNRYLRTICVDPAITEGFDILEWWKDQGSNYYKTLARMAREALAMPTCNQLSSKQTAQLKSILRGY